MSAHLENQTVLALDGGNSKTDVVLISGAGAVLARARSGPFIPHRIGAGAAVDSLEPAIRSVLADAGVPSADYLTAYLANADLPIEEDRIRDAMIGQGWASTVAVENDTLAMLRAGTDERHGVAVVCGAGINCVGIAEDGRRLRFPALGRITGDWGGGLFLAKETLWSTSRAEDGRGPDTALSAAVARHFGRPTAVAVAQALHLGEIDHDRIHELVPVLLDVAESGDAVAVSLVRRQVEEIALLVTVTLERLDLLSTPTDIVLGGGILTSGRAVILDPLIELLAQKAPLGRVRFPSGVAVIGSALLGLARLWAGSDEQVPHAGSAAFDRVRRELQNVAASRSIHPPKDDLP